MRRLVFWQDVDGEVIVSQLGSRMSLVSHSSSFCDQKWLPELLGYGRDTGGFPARGRLRSAGIGVEFWLAPNCVAFITISILVHKDVAR